MCALYNLRSVAGSGNVVDNDTGLVVVAVDVEDQAGSIVLERIGLHVHAAGNKFALFKERGHAIKYVIARTLDVASGLLLKRLHAVDVHGARTGDEIAFVVVFSAERKGDQVAAVVKDFLVDKVVTALVPPAGIYMRDALTWFGG